MLLHQWGTLLLVVLATHTNATVEGNELQQQQEKISTTQWPSLLFVIKTERSFINGHTDFSIVANPIVSADESTVAYDIFATFTVGTNLYNYTRVGSAAYLETMMVDSSTSLVQCLQSELDDLPPIDAIIAAVNQATPVSNQLKVCTSKDVYQVTVGTLTFALSIRALRCLHTISKLP
ncbi:hypothetical protein CCR75_009335 [Bremia lactucae]|uniref:Uncharacterized protein n=1 Tax=Bremia lactucae TaxID=4779 RepID=A0A976FPG2_BRELC|nr:hypothetical protein CCR75_009335 [Bremia lactucae]